MDQNELIDIVIPWVDPLDSAWQKAKRLYTENLYNTNITDEKFFRDWNTLLFLFRSIEKNLPWANKIHFLTYGHIPRWMNVNHDKLRIHNHKDFFKKEHSFPVFSSDAIEMNLSSIPDLSEKFIYFNDDEIVIRPVNPDRFFINNLPVDALMQDIPRGGWLYRLIRTKDVYPEICKNCVRPLNGFLSKQKLYKINKNIFYDRSYSTLDKLKNLIFNISHKYYWIHPNHAPQPLLLSSIYKCESLFSELINKTANSRFRSSHDICHYLFRNYNLITGSFIPRKHNDNHCIVLSDYKSVIRELEDIKKYSIVCINDSEFLSHNDYIKLRPILENKLSQIFPAKSKFEI